MNKSKAKLSRENPVQVLITVTRFKDIFRVDADGKGRATNFTMTMAKRDPRAFVKGQDLYVRQPTYIEFTVRSLASRKVTFFPNGITYVRRSEECETEEQRLGLINFPQSETRLNEHTIVVADTYRDPDPRVVYKFSLVVQRGSDGAIGIIDPDIIHGGEP